MKSAEAHEIVAPVDATGLRRRQSRDRDRDFDEVDARIQIPVHTQLKMKMNRKMNGADDARVLQSGINKYRSLQQRAAGAAPAATNIDNAVDRGNALVDKKQYAAAIPYFSEAITALEKGNGGGSLQSKVRLHYQRGICYMAAQKYKPAIEDFSAVINMTPMNAQLFAKRGHAYAALGENHAALLDFSKAINLTSTQRLLSDDHHGTSVMVVGGGSSYSGSTSSDSVTQLRALVIARAKVYRAMNQLTNALDDLGRAEKYDGQRDAELYHLRAQVFLQCRQEQPALRDLDRFLELQEEHNMQMETTSVLGSQANSSETRRKIVEVLMERAKIVQRIAAEEDAQERKDVEMSEVEQGRSRQAGTTGKSSQGTTTKKQATGKKQQGPRPYKGMQAKRMVKQAIHDYSRVLELDPEHGEALRRRGEAFGQIERYEEALEDFNRALELESNDFEVHMSRAKLYQQRGDIARAIEEVTIVLRENGFFIDGLFYRARLYEELGELRKAQADYTSIIDGHYDHKGDAALSSTSNSGTVETTILATVQRNGATLASGHRIPNGQKLSPTRSSAFQSGGSSSGAASPGSTSTVSIVKTGKMISDVSAEALICRARILLQREQFDAAIADYQQILDSPSKSSKRLDAQLELQSAEESKKTFEVRRQQEAVAWLEQKVEEEEGWEDLSKTGSVPGANGSAANTSSVSKSKKKKNRKSKKKKKASGYVLLKDDEDGEIVDEPSSENGEKNEDRRANEDDYPDRHASNLPTAEQDDKAVESVDADPVEDVDSVRPNPSAVNEALQKSVSSPQQGPKVVIMTRDEAFDSLWEENEEDTQSPEVPRTAHDDSGEESGSSSEEKDGTNRREESRREDAKQNAEEDEEDEDGEDAAGSATDSTGNDKVTVREVLMDEKYLKKRQRQLEKLRANLLEFTASGDKAAIREVLERVDRKKMTDALAEEVAVANSILETKEVEGTPVSGDSNSSSAASSHERAANEDGDTEEPEILDDVTTSRSSVAFDERSSSTPGFKLHVASPANRDRKSETTRDSSSPSTVTAASESSGDGTSVSPIGGGKPPALVIRPIAYSQALQVAEQNQNDLLQHQRLVQEKDAEIAYLKQLLTQTRQAEIFSHLDHLDTRDSDFQTQLVQLRTKFPAQRVASLRRSVEDLVEWMGPTGDADYVRQKILTFVQRVLESQFPPGTPIMFYPTGSYPMKTYLPTADLDICLVLPKELEPTWYFAVMHALCLAGNSDLSVASAPVSVMNGSPTTSKLASGAAVAAAALNAGAAGVGGVPLTPSVLTNTVRNVSFINADVRVIKCTIDNVAVDLTANRVAALGAVTLLDEMDARVGKDHLLKRSLIVIKAWCVHESATYTSTGGNGSGSSTSSNQSVMGASHGAFATYAINTIVMALFNQYGDTITHPLQALYLFLDRMAEFPWHEAAMTLNGAVPLSVLATTPIAHPTVAASKKSRAKSYTFGEAVAGAGRTDAPVSKQFEAVMEAEDLVGIRMSLFEQFAPFDPSLAASMAGEGAAYKSMFPVRVCNIVDPLDEKNNLARSVSADWFPMMKRAFRLGRNRLAVMLLGDKNASDSIPDFFAQSWQMYGRGDGWRPDLLVHPRQTWHGKATLNSVDARTAKVRDEMRWESLLPVPPHAAGLVPTMYGVPFHPQLHPHHQQQPFYAPHPHPHGHQRIATSPITIANGAVVGSGASGYFSQQQQQPQQQQQRRAFAGAKSSPQRMGQAETKGSPQRGGAFVKARRYDSPPPYAVHYSSK